MERRLSLISSMELNLHPMITPLYSVLVHPTHTTDPASAGIQAFGLQLVHSLQIRRTAPHPVTVTSEKAHINLKTMIQT